MTFLEEVLSGHVYCNRLTVSWYSLKIVAVYSALSLENITERKSISCKSTPIKDVPPNTCPSPIFIDRSALVKSTWRKSWKSNMLPISMEFDRSMPFNSVSLKSLFRINEWWKFTPDMLELEKSALCMMASSMCPFLIFVYEKFGKFINEFVRCAKLRSVYEKSTE